MHGGRAGLDLETHDGAPAGARGALGASPNGDAALAAATTPAAELVGALLAEGDGAPPGRLAAAARLVGSRATERLLAWVIEWPH